MRNFVSHKNIVTLLELCVNTILSSHNNLPELGRLNIKMELSTVCNLINYLKNYKVRQNKTPNMNNIK